MRCEKFVFEVIFAGLIGLTKEADSVLDDKLLKLQGSEAGSAAAATVLGMFASTFLAAS